MAFLLKIVEGPNRGAEIALVDGVSVTLGKGDDCDIVLADATLPEEPLALEVANGVVLAGGEPLAPFLVKTLGATSFAVGPADAPWGELSWPEKEASGQEASGQKPEDGKQDGGESSHVPPPTPQEEKASPEPKREKRKRGGLLGCLVLLLIILIVLLWFLLPHLRGGSGDQGLGESAGLADVLQLSPLAAIAERYGLVLGEDGDGHSTLSGNFATRADRLHAAAEAYAASPGVELDFSDDESLRSAAEDLISLVSAGALKVTAATNRFVALSGSSPSSADLRATLEALAADIPKLQNVDTAGVTVTAISAVAPASGNTDGVLQRQSARSATPALPVCGILTTPYPCLVLSDGRRILEGAPLGDWTVVEIGADSVTVTNATDRFVWKP